MLGRVVAPEFAGAGSPGCHGQVADGAEQVALIWPKTETAPVFQSLRKLRGGSPSPASHAATAPVIWCRHTRPAPTARSAIPARIDADPGGNHPPTAAWRGHSTEGTHMLRSEPLRDRLSGESALLAAPLHTVEAALWCGSPAAGGKARGPWEVDAPPCGASGGGVGQLKLIQNWA